jgi:hypothetical protein
VITRAYRVIPIREVDPGDTVLTSGGSIKVERLESTADGVKLIGKKGNDVDHRATPVTVARGADVVMLAGHEDLDEIEAFLLDQKVPNLVTFDDEIVTVATGPYTWTLPRRGHEEAWLSKVLPPAPATVPAPKPHPAPPSLAPAGDPKAPTMQTVESKGG